MPALLVSGRCSGVGSSGQERWDKLGDESMVGNSLKEIHGVCEIAFQVIFSYHI